MYQPIRCPKILTY